MAASLYIMLTGKFRRDYDTGGDSGGIKIKWIARTAWAGDEVTFGAQLKN
jgi:hypothetical protein